MTHYQFKLKQAYEQCVISTLLLDFPREVVLELIKSYSRRMHDAFFAGVPYYKLAVEILNENYAQLSAYKYAVA